jgi:hypothetical protein
MAKAPEAIPAAPDPAIARPVVNMLDDTAEAQRMEPMLNKASETWKVRLLLKYM